MKFVFLAHEFSNISKKWWPWMLSWRQLFMKAQTLGQREGAISLLSYWERGKASICQHKLGPASTTFQQTLLGPAAAASRFIHSQLIFLIYLSDVTLQFSHLRVVSFIVIIWNCSARTSSLLQEAPFLSLLTKKNHQKPSSVFLVVAAKMTPPQNHPVV